MKRVLLCAIAVWAFGSAVHAQTPPDTVVSIARLDAQIASLEDLLEREVWPGYRYTQLGLMYVIPGRAKLATHWPGQGPSGMTALPGFSSVLWTDTSVVRWPQGLPVASLAISPKQTRAAVAGLALHEAFHAFEVTQRRDDRRFGRGENAMLTSQYPVFDIENEAAVAVEAKLLLRAVQAKSIAEAKAHARQFIAVRKQRQSKLDSAFVNFEKLSEMHEGIAQYVLLRGLDVLAKRIPEFAEGAAYERDAEAELLGNTLARTNLSVRRRAYALGSYQGLLLDRLAPRTWKQRVMDKDEFLQDILADVAGPAAISVSTKSMLQAAVADAARSVSALRERRINQRDEILAKEATTLVIDPSALAARFDWCGFDPQNLITTGAGQMLHNRMINLCSRGKPLAQIYQPAVEDQLTGRILTPVKLNDLVVTVNGSVFTLPDIGAVVTVDNVKVTTADVTIETARAVLIRSENTIVFLPLRMGS